jgi:hypothetical protein
MQVAGVPEALRVLELQRTIGNRQVSRLLTSANRPEARTSTSRFAASRRLLRQEANPNPFAGPPPPRGPQDEGTPGDRPELYRGDTGPAVTLLQSLLGTPKTGVFDAATVTAVTALQLSDDIRPGRVGASTWEALEERHTAITERVNQPVNRIQIDISDEHKTRVAAVVNRHMLNSYNISAGRAKGEKKTVGDHLKRARDTVSDERNESNGLSVNILLRDAQRYLYGRLSPYTDAALLEKWGEGKASQVGVFDRDPDRKNMLAAARVTEKYETIKFELPDELVRTNPQRPASPLGGIDFYNKGVYDSMLDTAGDRWKLDTFPLNMDIKNFPNSFSGFEYATPIYALPIPDTDGD